ncbi:unnamed protein product [Lampetra fluviatilis]
MAVGLMSRARNICLKMVKVFKDKKGRLLGDLEPSSERIPRAVLRARIIPRTASRLSCTGDADSDVWHAERERGEWSKFPTTGAATKKRRFAHVSGSRHDPGLDEEEGEEEGGGRGCGQLEVDQRLRDGTDDETAEAKFCLPVCASENDDVWYRMRCGT